MKKSNQFVASSFVDSKIFVGTLDENQVLQVNEQLQGHNNLVNCMISNIQEDLLISGSHDAAIRFWNKQKFWECQQTIVDDQVEVWAIRLNPLLQFNKAIFHDSFSVQGYFFKAYVLSEMQNHIYAIQCYDQVIRLNPNLAEAYNNKGNNLQKLSKYEDAIQCYNIAILLKPNLAIHTLTKGMRQTDFFKTKINNLIMKGVALKNLENYKGNNLESKYSSSLQQKRYIQAMHYFAQTNIKMLYFVLIRQMNWIQDQRQLMKIKGICQQV